METETNLVQPSSLLAGSTSRDRRSKASRLGLAVGTVIYCNKFDDRKWWCGTIAAVSEDGFCEVTWPKTNEPGKSNPRVRFADLHLVLPTNTSACNLSTELHVNPYSASYDQRTRLQAHGGGSSSSSGSSVNNNENIPMVAAAVFQRANRNFVPIAVKKEPPAQPKKKKKKKRKDRKRQKDDESEGGGSDGGQQTHKKTKA